MKTVMEVSRLTGVSVRALHHYDAIGLLKPSKVTEAGYRLYDNNALRRLQAILLFRELQFPLKEIKNILDSPVFDPDEALRQQIHLMELQKQRLEDLIHLAHDIQTKGFDTMDFHTFDKTKQEQYAEEVRTRWGQTEAYQEYKQRGSAGNGDALMALFADLGKLRQLPQYAPRLAAEHGRNPPLPQHNGKALRKSRPSSGQLQLAFG